MVGENCSTNTHRIVRVVFVVGLMVLWLFAGTVVFGGSVAADQSLNVADGDFDSAVFFQGNEITLTDLDQLGISGDSWIQLRRITSRDSDNNPESTEAMYTQTVSEDGSVTFDTEPLEEGDYVLRAGNNRYLSSSSASVPNEFSKSAGDDDIAEAEVVIQTLSAAFDDDEVVAGNTVGFQLESPERGGYYEINVSADGLSVDQLRETFSDLESEGVIDGIDDTTSAAEDTIILEGPDNFIDEEVTFASAIGADEYEFDFDVTDTTANARASITVNSDADQSDLTYTFDIPNDGETYSVGIPGEIDGSLADMIDPDAEGYTIFRFEDGSWQPVSDFENTELDALEAITIATEDGSGQPESFTLEMEFATQPETAVPPQKDLQEGWNFVAAPQRGDADTVFGIQNAFLVLDRFEEAPSSEIQAVGTFDNHFIGSDQNTVGPFKGYYVYAEDDTTLPGVLAGVETRDDIDSQLGIDVSG